MLFFLIQSSIAIEQSMSEQIQITLANGLALTSYKGEEKPEITKMLKDLPDTFYFFPLYINEKSWSSHVLNKTETDA